MTDAVEVQRHRVAQAREEAANRSRFPGPGWPADRDRETGVIVCWRNHLVRERTTAFPFSMTDELPLGYVASFAPAPRKCYTPAHTAQSAIGFGDRRLGRNLQSVIHNL